MNFNVIVTCAITGAGDTTSKSPHVPVTPDEIANSAIEAAKAGASVVHLHVRDPKTGKGFINENGEPTKFVPNSCRSKCPVETSTSFRDDPRMAARLEAAHKDHEAWKTTMSNHAKEVSWLEIILREEEMRG